MENWQQEAQEMRRQLTVIANHPDTDFKARRQANEYLFYSDKGLFNYRMRIRHFINNSALRQQRIKPKQR